MIKVEAVNGDIVFVNPHYVLTVANLEEKGKPVVGACVVILVTGHKITAKESASSLVSRMYTAGGMTASVRGGMIQ